jgi:hypothetical protein
MEPYHGDDAKAGYRLKERAGKSGKGKVRMVTAARKTT